jgi:putative transposase
MKEIWLTTSQAAALEGVSRQAALNKVYGGDWDVKKEKIGRGGNGGSGYLVALSSLSTIARRRWYEQNAVEDVAVTEEVINEPDSIEEPTSGITKSLNLAEVKALVGDQRFNQLLEEADEKAKPVLEYLDLGDCTGKTVKAKIIARRHSISLKTLYRRVELYQEGGIAALMKRTPTLGTGTVRRSVTEEVERFARAEYLKRNQPKVSHVHKRVEKFCKLNGFDIPSRATTYRVIDDLKRYESDLVCLAREGEEEYMKRFAEKVLRKEPEFVNQVWEGDHHRMDFFISYKGKPHRPWLTVWEDVASRVITGWSLSIQANGRTIALALRHGILAKKMPAGLDSHMSKAMANSLQSLGWDLEMFKECAGQKLPDYGLPKTLYIDNGEDYKAKVRKGIKADDWEYSKEVRSSCELLNIEAKFCTKYSPWAKGHAERWFGTMTDQFSRYIPGYCGSDNKDRPFGLDEKVMCDRGELLLLEEACLLLEMYIYQYHNFVHSTLGMTPYEKYQMTPKARKEMPDDRTLDICLMDVEKAKVTATGIQRFGTQSQRRWYSHPLLEKYVGQSLVIRYDPNRIGELLIFNPKNGNYICTATNKELMDWDASKDDIKQFLKKRATRKKELKERLRGYQEVSLEEIVNERQEHGPVMTTGKNVQVPGDMRMITGMERTSKAKQAEKIQTETKKVVNSNRFDDYLRRVGNEN